MSGCFYSILLSPSSSRPSWPHPQPQSLETVSASGRAMPILRASGLHAPTSPRLLAPHPPPPPRLAGEGAPMAALSQAPTSLAGHTPLALAMCRTHASSLPRAASPPQDAGLFPPETRTTRGRKEMRTSRHVVGPAMWNPVLARVAGCTDNFLFLLLSPTWIC